MSTAETSRTWLSSPRADPRDAQREGERLCARSRRSWAGSRVPSEMSRERRREVAVEHPHHLLGRDPVGDHAGHERAGAGADVDVELVDRAVDGEQVERPQGPDLVHAAREPPTAEDERGLGLTPATSLAPDPPATPSAGSRARRPSPWSYSLLLAGQLAPCFPCGAGRLRIVALGGRLARSSAGACTGGRVDLALPA